MGPNAAFRIESVIEFTVYNDRNGVDPVALKLVNEAAAIIPRWTCDIIFVGSIQRRRPALVESVPRKGCRICYALAARLKYDRQKYGYSCRHGNHVAALVRVCCFHNLSSPSAFW